MLSCNSAGASEAQLDRKFLEHDFFSNNRKLSQLIYPLSYYFSEKVNIALTSGQNSENYKYVAKGLKAKPFLTE